MFSPQRLAPNDPSVAVRSKFLALSLELRQKVYNEYLTNSSRPNAKEIHENILPSDNFTLPLLLASKQVSEEVLDCLIRQKQCTYRVTWQGADFDGLALSCIRACKIQRADYASLPHLRIEVYPPHPDRPSDIVNILRSVIALCEELRPIDRLHHVCIVFIENEIAKWPGVRKRRKSTGNSVGRWQESDDAFNIEHILRLFGTLRNITNATIRLPESFPDNLFLRKKNAFTVQQIAAKFKKSMMSSVLLDKEMVAEFVLRLKMKLDVEEPYLQRATGRKSLKRFKAQGYGGWCTVPMDYLCNFLRVWPYIVSFDCDEYNGGAELPMRGLDRSPNGERVEVRGRQGSLPSPLIERGFP